MSRQIFLNLPVADLPRSVAFFEALGFTRKPEFSDDTGAGLVISDTIWLMLTTHARFKTFTPKEVCDTSRAVEVLISLSCDSKEEVDALVAKALAAGGSTYDQPEDLGFMYSHSFVDLDGHGWGSCTCRARRRDPVIPFQAPRGAPHDHRAEQGRTQGRDRLHRAVLPGEHG